MKTNRRLLSLFLSMLFLLNISVTAYSDDGTIHEHSLEFYPELPATCATPGNNSYWYCSNCDSFFLDEECLNQTTLEELIIPAFGHSFTNYIADDNADCTNSGTKTAICDHEGCSETDTIPDEANPAIGHVLSYISAQEATCTESGNSEYWYCQRCGSSFSDEAAEFPIEISETTIPPKKQMEHFDTVSATCTQAGVVEHWHCLECGKNYAKEDHFTEISTEYFPAVPSQYGVDGVREYWKCTGCGRIFLDEDCTTESSVEDLIDPARDYYNITYFLFGGENDENNPDVYYPGETLATLYDPAKEGYSFAGWYLDEEFSIPAEAPQIKPETTGNLVFYASWSANSYTIRFNSNGGSGKMSDMVNTLFDDEILLEKNRFTKKGYEFVGWNTSADGTGIPFSDEASVCGLSPNDGECLTLYAQWEESVYSITYFIDGGTNSDANPDYYTMPAAAIKLAGAEKSGYTFSGWYSDSSLKKKVTQIPKGATGDIELYAKWVPINYSIRYNLDRGINSKSNPTTYTIESPRIRFLAATKKGYAFDGWYLDSALTNQIYAIESGNIGSIILYAKWSPAVFTVKFDGNGSTSGKMPDTDMTGAHEITIPKNCYIKKGYILLKY